MINFPCKKHLVSLYNKIRYNRIRYKLSVRRRSIFLDEVIKKAKINVVFIAANLAMWQYSHLYYLMKKNKRFNVNVIIAPLPNYSENERRDNANELKAYFSLNHIEYIDGQDYNFDIEKELKPDILFYTQYYTHVYKNNYDAWHFRSRLLCAYPYGFKDCNLPSSYNNSFQNIAWKLYYATNEDFKNAQNSAFNKGENVVVVGCPHADDFLSTEINDVWKLQNIQKKRIIYAPHFTIEKGLSPLFFSNFLKFGIFFQQIANKYCDKIQFAFKPHPRLRTELYKHKDWGKDKTDDYYAWWENQDNTQLETEGFIDLFKTSDAMIHDCGSFSIEYLYTRKPIMYLSRDIEEIKKCKNEVGKNALDTHYIGENEQDIINFIENTVLKGIDPMEKQREVFFENYLLPPNGKTVAQNTLDDILQSLEIE